MRRKEGYDTLHKQTDTVYWGRAMNENFVILLRRSWVSYLKATGEEEVKWFLKKFFFPTLPLLQQSFNT